VENINKFKIMANCITCEHPLVNFTDYLLDLIEVQEIETAEEFRVMMQDVLDTGYFVHVNTKNLCCPDCPSTNCGAGVWYFGKYSRFKDFTQFLGLDVVPPTSYVCCTNYFSNPKHFYTEGSGSNTTNCTLYSCCNQFNQEYINQLLTTFISFSGIYSLIVINDTLSGGVFEYSTFQGDSSLGIILDCFNRFSDVFKPVFFELLFKGIVISCACQENSVGVMSITRFLECSI
jgi:hypothetical protein